VSLEGPPLAERHVVDAPRRRLGDVTLDQALADGPRHETALGNASMLAENVSRMHLDRHSPDDEGSA